MNQKMYSPAEVSQYFKCEVSTLRKYSILLENAGITFNRNERNQRMYSDDDIMIIDKFFTLKNNGGMSLKECADAVYLWANGNEETTPPSTESYSDAQRYDRSIEELKIMLYEQSKLVYGLYERLDKQDEEIQQLKEKSSRQQIETIEEPDLIETAEVEDSKESKLVEEVEEVEEEYTDEFNQQPISSVQEDNQSVQNLRRKHKHKGFFKRLFSID